MKQKYSIMVGEKESDVIIKEFAELDKGLFSRIFAEKFDREALQEAAKAGKVALIEALRTPSFFPIGLCADRLADALADFLKTDGGDTLEVLFDDFESLAKEEKKEAPAEEEDESVEIDTILDDEIDDENYLEEEDIKSISSANTTIKLADDVEVGTADDDAK